MFWPACHLVRGKPHHSESNGGVERSNRTIEDKLGLWMSENKSQHWSGGLPLVQWEMIPKPIKVLVERFRITFLPDKILVSVFQVLQ
jgi:hypothetical protein